jgi:hypothetical protein
MGRTLGEIGEIPLPTDIKGTTPAFAGPCGVVEVLQTGWILQMVYVRRGGPAGEEVQP